MISAFTSRSVNDQVVEGRRSRPSNAGGRAGTPGAPSNRGLFSRLLLRHAVDRAKSPDQIARVYRHYLARGKEFCKRVKGDAIIGIVEYRDQHRSIRDVKIGVAGGELPIFKQYRAR